MKYKAINIVHTELSIADKQIHRKKKDIFFSLPPSGFFLSFTCTETSCGSCCSQSSRENRDVFSSFFKV